MAKSVHGRKWITVGAVVIHRKTSKRGELLEFRGVNQADRLLVRWEDGKSQWVQRREIKTEN